jgi:hypothetical protein
MRQATRQQQQEEGQFAAGVERYFGRRHELTAEPSLITVPVEPMAELSTQRPPVELQASDPVRYEHITDKEPDWDYQSRTPCATSFS